MTQVREEVVGAPDFMQAMDRGMDRSDFPGSSTPWMSVSHLDLCTLASCLQYRPAPRIYARSVALSLSLVHLCKVRYYHPLPRSEV
jgi:hypothetical protein